jgi:uncharacterized membrane protein HdeD (DUF308 family)
MSAATTAGGEIKKSAGMLTFFGILMVIFGFLAMGSPFVAGLAVVWYFGVMLVIGGIFRVIYAFKAQSLGSGMWAILVGFLTVFAGLALLGRPMLGLAVMTLILAVYFIIEGITEIIYAFQLKPELGWAWALVGGIISLALGVMIWRAYPAPATWLIGVLVGIHLLFQGLAMLGIGAAARAVSDGVDEIIHEAEEVAGIDPK